MMTEPGDDETILEIDNPKKVAAALADGGSVVRIERTTSGRLLFHISNLDADWPIRLANGLVLVNAQAMIDAMARVLDWIADNQRQSGRRG